MRSGVSWTARKEMVKMLIMMMMMVIIMVRLGDHSEGLLCCEAPGSGGVTEVIATMEVMIAISVNRRLSMVIH